MQVYENALKVGTTLDDRYELLEILGEGGFGITYKARDTKLDCLVAIKEFLPQELAARAHDTISVQPRTNRTDDYQYGLTRFLEEARTLAKFQHANIVRVSNFIEANGTAYFVMDYAEGEELGEWLDTQPGSLSEEAILNIITPILEGLTVVHREGLLHRDIKPANIFLRREGGPMLIDFGAARQAISEKSKSMSAIISEGYAPPEQYSTHGKQGPYTDLYAIGATLYHLITATKPIDASARSHAIHEEEDDPLIPAVVAGKGRVGDWLLALTDQLLNIVSKQRPQTAQAVLEAISKQSVANLNTDQPVASDQSKQKTRRVSETERFSKTPDIREPNSGGKGLWGYVTVAGVFLAIGVAYFVGNSFQGETPNLPVSEAIEPVTSISSETTPPGTQSESRNEVTTSDDFLSPDEAFQLTVNFLDHKTVELNWHIADQYMMYRRGFSFSIDGIDIPPEAITFPKGQMRNDELFGEVEIYTGDIRILLALQNSGLEQRVVELDARSQGLFLSGLVYPPHSQKQTITLPVSQAAIREQQREAEAARIVEEKRKVEEANKIAEEKRRREVEQTRRLEKEYVGEMVRVGAILIGKYEITQKQWESVMGSNPSDHKSCGGQCPVENVSMNEINEFISRVSQKIGKKYRLPTEDEWEKACGSDNKICSSDAIETSGIYFFVGEKPTNPVGHGVANESGLFGMHSNVWEWTSSCYQEDCSSYYLRGGAPFYNPMFQTTSGRFTSSKFGRDPYVGFRLVRDYMVDIN